jgi:type II secretory pathway component GspD/PulD (secretin)
MSAAPSTPATAVTPAPSAPAAAASPAPYASGAAASPVVIQADGDEKFTLNFRNMPIEEVFELLSRKDKVNIIVSKGVTGLVSVNLYRVTLKEAIQRRRQRRGPHGRDAQR